jgi:multisubunit Na+/H+ antiporter MnhG subunit
MNLLLTLFFFFRPVMFVDLGWKIVGLNITEFFAVVASAILIAAYVLNLIFTKQINVSVVDFFIVFFIIWCLFVYVLYIDKADIKDSAKFALPFFTYIVMKNIVKNRQQYTRLLYIMILGYAIPVFSSAFLIVQGKGLDRVMYWTGLHRFQGVYVNPHNMAHCMTFLLMIICIYAVICTVDPKLKPMSKRKLTVVFFTVLSMLALYCLYNSFVRTCFLGLAVFVYYYLFRINKKALIIITVAVGIIGVMSAAVLYTIFFDMVDAAEGKTSAERFGSGRPYIWMHNLTEFSNFSLDRKLAGAGIGNRRNIHSSSLGDDVWNSHNDLLEVLMQTGIIGFIIFIMMQFFMFQKIRRLEGREKYIFLALFFAVFFMNCVSNSYIVRFGLGQMYYIVLSYIELPIHEQQQTDMQIEEAHALDMKAKKSRLIG